MILNYQQIHPSTLPSLKVCSTGYGSCYDDCNQLFLNGGLYHIETSLLICRANQWTGFYMIGTSISVIIQICCLEKHLSFVFHFSMQLTLFLANIPISHLLKTPENPWFSSVYRRYKIAKLARIALWCHNRRAFRQSCFYQMERKVQK